MEWYASTRRRYLRWAVGAQSIASIQSTFSCPPFSWLILRFHVLPILLVLPQKVVKMSLVRSIITEKLEHSVISSTPLIRISVKMTITAVPSTAAGLIVTIWLSPPKPDNIQYVFQRPRYGPNHEKPPSCPNRTITVLRLWHSSHNLIQTLITWKCWLLMAIYSMLYASLDKPPQMRKAHTHTHKHNHTRTHRHTRLCIY